MRERSAIYIIDLALAMIFIALSCLLLNYYPVAHLTWDSFYYVKTSITHEYGIRPSGYAHFLNLIYGISHELKAVVFLQLALHFFASICLLKTLRKVTGLNVYLYALLGILFLSDPVVLYHCNSVLSDLVFSSLTIIALSCLLLYLHSKKYCWFVLHLVLIFTCIEIRHIGLFYPFFTCGILLLFAPWSRVLLLSIAITLVAYFGLYKWHVNQNKKHYYVSVYSAFSGWTHANNALYALPLVKLDANTIRNEDIRKMHEFVSAYMDTSDFKVNYETVGSDFLWDDKSPLNVLRLKLVDSLKVDYNTSWYLSAPYYHYYGTYIERHFPLQYIRAYMVPNTRTLINPQLGEMSDYYIMKFSDPVTLERYGLKEADLKCKEQVYKDRLNNYIQVVYKVLLTLFVLSIALFLLFFKRFDGAIRRVLFVILLYTVLFYAFTLYSSWFMFRYLLPVYPLMYTFILFVIYRVGSSFITKNKPS